MLQEYVHSWVAPWHSSCMMCCHYESAGNGLCMWSGLPVFPHEQKHIIREELLGQHSGWMWWWLEVLELFPGTGLEDGSKGTGAPTTKSSAQISVKGVGSRDIWCWAFCTSRDPQLAFGWLEVRASPAQADVHINREEPILTPCSICFFDFKLCFLLF